MAEAGAGLLVGELAQIAGLLLAFRLHLSFPSHPHHPPPPAVSFPNQSHPLLRVLRAGERGSRVHLGVCVCVGGGCTEPDAGGFASAASKKARPAGRARGKAMQQVPDEILHNLELLAAISQVWLYHLLLPLA